MNDATHEITSPYWRPGEKYLVNEANPGATYSVLTGRTYERGDSWLDFYKTSKTVIIKDIAGVTENE